MIERFYPKADKIKTLIYVGEHPLDPDRIVLIDKSSGLSLVMDRISWNQLPEKFEQALSMQMKILTKQIGVIRSIYFAGKEIQVPEERQALIRRISYT